MWLKRQFTVRFVLVLIALVAVLLVAIVRPPLEQYALMKKIEPLGPTSIYVAVADHREGWQKKYWEFVREKFGYEYASLYTCVVINEPSMGDDDLKFLFQIPTIQQLDLSHTQITDKFTQHLNRFKYLESVRFENTNLTDATIDALDDLSLLRLSFRHTAVSAARRERYLEEHEAVVKWFGWSPRTYPEHTEAIQNCVQHGFHVTLFGRIECSGGQAEDGSLNLEPLRALPEFGLYLSDAKLNAENIRGLQELQNLVSLSLNGGSCDDLGWLAALPSLRELTLNSTSITNGLSGIEKCVTLTQIRILSRNLELSEEILKAFPDDSRLGSIDLDYPVGPRSGLFCEQLIRFKRLRHLDLYDVELTPCGWQHLGQIRSLESLRIDGSSISDDDVAALVPLTQLQSLTVAYTNLTDKSIGTILGFSKLTRIDVAGTQITKSGLRRLREGTDAEVFYSEEENGP